MPSDVDYRLARQALDTLDLDPLKHRPITELSGGERQLAMLARAIAQQTSILLLDEPTSHLDLSNKGRFLQVLRTLAGQGVTIIYHPRARRLLPRRLLC